MLNPFCLGLAATPAAVGSPSCSLTLAPWEGAGIWDVAARCLSCAGSVLAGCPTASPLPAPALLPAHGFWQEHVQPDGWKSLLRLCHSQLCDTVKLISRAVKLLWASDAHIRNCLDHKTPWKELCFLRNQLMLGVYSIKILVFKNLMENYLSGILGRRFIFWCIFTQVCCPLADKNGSVLLPYNQLNKWHVLQTQ